MASTKQRYVYLDGIRGIAALFVLMRHTTDYWDFVVYRSYLSVDMFFILSGFVIANAYGKKMEAGALSLPGFVRVRLIRLYPAYFLALCLAIPVYLGGLAAQGVPLSLTETLQVIALSLLFLPGVMIPGGLLFSVNGPYWSLFFELIANFIYGFLRPLLVPKVLTTLVAVLGLLLLGMSAYHGSMDFGFLFEVKAVIAGLVRASFGIFFGILLHPKVGRWNIRPRPWLAIALMCGVFLVPAFGRYDFILDCLTLYFIFPACVVLAASTTSDRYSKLMLSLGSASYPMYVLHEPIGQLFLIATGGGAAAFAPYSGWLMMLFLVLLASQYETKVDEPVRKWLSRSFIRQNRPAPKAG